MTEPIPQRRIFVTYDTARETRILINDPERISDIDLQVTMQCRMSVDPQRNRGVVVAVNLAERTRADISGIIESTLDLRGASRGLADLYTPEQLVNIALLEQTLQKVTTIEIGGGYCEIDAGTDRKVGRVFEGSVSRIRSTKSGPEWRTRFEIGDGLTTATGAVANQPFGDGAKVFDVIRHVVKSLGLSIGTLTLQQFQDAVGANVVSVLPRGYIAMGNSNAVLKQLLQFSGAEWFVDRGTIYIVKKGHPIDPAAAPVVIEQDVDGGMRSVPTPIDENGILVESDFRQDVRIGRLVETRARQLSGVWRAEVVDHQIDNRAGAWLTRAILRKLPEQF